MNEHIEEGAQAEASPSNETYSTRSPSVKSSASRSDDSNRDHNMPPYFKRYKLEKVGDTFPVLFSRYSRRPYVDESYVIVNARQESNPMQLRPSEYAFVIEINGVNVQHVIDPKQIEDSVGRNEDELDILLSFPSEPGKSKYRVSAKIELFRNFHCELGLFVKKITDPVECPFKLFDEVVMVNGKPVEKRSIEQIEERARGKSITFVINRAKPRENINDDVFQASSLVSVKRISSVTAMSDRSFNIDNLSESSETMTNTEPDRPIPPYDISNRIVKVLNVENASAGMTLAGGNMVGIFVEKVERWTPAFKEEVTPGWRILSICDAYLDNCTLEYAINVLNHFQQQNIKELKICFEGTTQERYESAMENKPNDFFTVEALTSYSNMSDGLSFKKGDKINVTSTFCHSQHKGEDHCWKGYLPLGNMAQDDAKLIPSISQSPNTKTMWRGPKEGFYYKVITEGVKVSLRISPVQKPKRQSIGISV